MRIKLLSTALCACFSPVHMVPPDAQGNVTVDEIVDQARADTTRAGSVQKVIAGLRQQVTDALSGVTLPPAVQAKLNEVFSTMHSNADVIDVALNTNVPPAA